MIGDIVLRKLRSNTSKQVVRDNWLFIQYDIL